MGVLVLLIIPSFVLFGVEGYNNRDARGVVVAQIGDVEITQQQWDAMHQQEVDKIRASMPVITKLSAFLSAPMGKDLRSPIAFVTRLRESRSG